MVLSCSLFHSIFFFVKQKTADEMRISDWSSDVCSSDLADENADHIGPETKADVKDGDLVIAIAQVVEQQAKGQVGKRVADFMDQDEQQIGRASWRDSV